MATAKQLKKQREHNDALIAEQNRKPQSKMPIGTGNPHKKDKVVAKDNIKLNRQIQQEEAGKLMQHPVAQKITTPRKKATGEPGMNHFGYGKI